jgi:hypothetical protein
VQCGPPWKIDVYSERGVRAWPFQDIGGATRPQGIAREPKEFHQLRADRASNFRERTKVIAATTSFSDHLRAVLRRSVLDLPRPVFRYLP